MAYFFLRTRQEVGWPPKSARDDDSALIFSIPTAPLFPLNPKLPDASWKAVSSALAATEKASSQLFHPTALKKMKESAQAEAKAQAEAESSARVNDQDGESKKSASEGGNNPRQRKKQYEATYDRLYQRKLREKRASAASAWSSSVSDAASRVWNLHRVLARRNDPVTRKNFLEVVSESPVPAEFGGAERRLLALQNKNGGGGGGGDGTGKGVLSRANFSLFSLFWVEMSIGLGGRISRLMKFDNGGLEGDVAAMYPAVRSASLSMVTELYDIMQMGLSSSDAGDASVGGLSSAVAGSGVMGGSAALEDSVFFGGGDGGGGGGLDSDDYFGRADEAAGVGGVFFGASADAWTHVDTAAGDDVTEGSLGTRAGASSASSSLTLAVFTSPEWVALQGENALDGTSTGLLALQTAFLKECKSRLFSPLEYLFPEAVSVDENGIAIPCLPTLPTRYDLAKLDANIREELSFADPRQGGGDFSMAPMISDVVVSMLIKFCSIARRAISDCEEGKLLDSRSGSISESMAHNLRVAGVMVCSSNSPSQLWIVNPYCQLLNLFSATAELPFRLRQEYTREHVRQSLPPRPVNAARGSIALVPYGSPSRLERDRFTRQNFYPGPPLSRTESTGINRPVKNASWHLSPRIGGCHVAAQLVRADLPRGPIRQYREHLPYTASE